MSQMAAMWTETANAFSAAHDQIGDKWDADTPCEGWTVKDVVQHAAGVQVLFGGALGLEAEEGADWPSVQAAMAAVIADPSNLEGEVDHPALGTMPKEQVLGIAITDLLIHTWDLARGIGADETLPAGPTQAALMGLQGLPPEVIRAPERFNDAIDIADGSSLQDQLIAFSGRQP